MVKYFDARCPVRVFAVAVAGDHFLEVVIGDRIEGLDNSIRPSVHDEVPRH